MEASNIPDEETVGFHKKFMKTFEIDQTLSILFTVLGMNQLFVNHLLGCDAMGLPIPQRYALLQSMSILTVLHRILNNSDDDINFEHLPVNEEAWQSLEDFEDRYYFVLKNYYENAVKEGKIKNESI